MQEYVSCVHSLDPEGSQKVNIKLNVGAIALGDGTQGFSLVFCSKIVWTMN